MIFKHLIFLTLLSPSPVWPQSISEDPPVSDNEASGDKKGEEKKVKPKAVSNNSDTNFKVRSEVAIEKEVEYLDLVKGVYKDVKFDDLPDENIFKLEDTSYKRYADIIYDNERKVMRFKPKKTGSFTLRFVNKRRPNLILKQVRVFVQQKNLNKIAREIKSLLREIEGIEIKVLNNKVIVDGFILLVKDMNRIAMVLNQYSESQVASLVRLSPLTKIKIADRIEAEIDNPNIYVEVINDFYILEGTESWEGEKKRAEKIAQAHISDTLTKFAAGNARGGTQIQPLIKDPTKIVINNIISVAPGKKPEKKLIQVVVHYVELSKEYKRGFNFSWAPSISESEEGLALSARSDNNDFISSFTATITKLLPRLNWARDHGHARVLNTMNVLVKEDKQGQVNSSTKITPVASSGLGGNPPGPIEAKIETSVTPKTIPDRPDNIEMKISVKIQQILSSDAVQVIKASNDVETVVTIKNKQTAAIGGLLRSRSATNYNRDPSGGANTLFRLGASKNLEREHGQFVVFLTPIIKSTASQGVEKVKRKFRIDK